MPTDFIERVRARAEAAALHIGKLCTKEDRWTMSVPPRDDDSDILLTQVAQDAEAAVEALARVRELHRPVESQWGDQACAECLNSWELEVVWPCATYKATEVDG